MCSASATEHPFPVIVGLFPSVFSILFPWTASFRYPKGQEEKSELAVPCMTTKLRAACEGKHAPSHAPMPAAMQQLSCSSLGKGWGELCMQSLLRAARGAHSPVLHGLGLHSSRNKTVISKGEGVSGGPEGSNWCSLQSRHLQHGHILWEKMSLEN